jgi:sulfite reductase (NADPH) hemoprotein beta-component
MKFLLDQMGFEAWRVEYDEERAALERDGGIALPFDPQAPPEEGAPQGERPDPPSVGSAQSRARAAQVRGPGITPQQRAALPLLNGAYGRWRRSNVKPQKQPGYAAVSVTLPLGDITAAQMRLCADLALAYGDGSVRISLDQDLFFRWIAETDVLDLYARLTAAGLGLPDAGTVADVTSCPGAESCRLAVTQSRGLGHLLGEHLRARPELVSAAEDLQIKISGCPNGCGQHHIAGLGFQGSVRRLGDKVIPQYFVMVGGGVDDDGARFGRLAAKVPSRRLPEALERLIGLYGDEAGAGESATAFFGRVELDVVKKRLADLEAITPDDARPEDFVDLAEQSEYRFEVMEGECSA